MTASTVPRRPKDVCEHKKQIITIFTPNSHGMKVFFCSECSAGWSSRMMFNAVVKGIENGSRKKQKRTQATKEQ